MSWVDAVRALRTSRESGVLVTLTSVRGHAPREAGTKMVVSATRTWGTIGGGNLEEDAIRRARTMVQDNTSEPVSFTANLSDKAKYQHGVQCCGGVVEVLLEPLAVRPSVAIFGMGHVGQELARVLARHDLELHLVDSREGFLTDDVLAPLADAEAAVHVHHVPVLPELVLSELPRGSHVLVMTHDHAEDAALIDAALRTEELASIGLIGSSAKWQRFRRKLLSEGHDEADLSRITTPIGLTTLSGKDPATIAVSIAAALLQSFAPTRHAPPDDTDTEGTAGTEDTAGTDTEPGRHAQESTR
ncbi:MULTISPECIES: xanthine dehydrogenase accessory protein XdhC [unclassified Knoellia]|uniref:xanthine dehydrogenase accessory protein XdhC n=1 Tax=Knoellia altitudinis TaxID=3404795 RepID=UPI0036196E7B